MKIVGYVVAHFNISCRIWGQAIATLKKKISKNQKQEHLADSRWITKSF